MENLSIASAKAAESFRKFGRVAEKFRDHFATDPQVIREAGVHFDLLCERHPGAALVELRIDDDGRAMSRVVE